MSTYANGTQQTYQEIWASMELVCASLMPAIRPAAAATAPDAVLDLTPASIEWPELGTNRHVREHPRRSARGRRRIAARIR
jgi:hypothetical protein